MPDSDKNAEFRTVRVGLLLTEGFALMSYAAFIEPLRAANSLANRPLYEWTHVSADGQEVGASNGVSLLPDTIIGEPINVDMLIVFAAGTPQNFRDDRCFAWLRAVARRGTTIGGVSGGPYLLARAGLLDGYRATVHWEHAAALQDEYPQLALEPGLFVIDRARITCAGGTAALDLAIKIIEKDNGIDLAREVGEWFIRSEAREPGHRQRPVLAERFGTRNARLLTMLEAMEQHIETPLNCAKLAALADISVRQLERLCRTELGRSIGETYMQLRLACAAQLLRSTDMSTTEVAMASGFRSPSHFSRRFKAAYGFPPSHRKLSSAWHRYSGLDGR